MDKVSKKYLKELVEALVGIKNKNEMELFLEGIFTPKELLEIPRRLQIVKMLRAGVAHRAVAEKLGVGIATVTRGSNEIHSGKFKNID